MSNFSENLHSAPFIRLIVPFIGGIVSGFQAGPEYKWIFLGISLFFVLLLPLLVSHSYRREPLFGIFLFPALFFLGIFISIDRNYAPAPLPMNDYYAVAHEFPVEKENTNRMVVRLLAPHAKVLAYIDKSFSLEGVEPGTVIWFRGQPDLLITTGNPFEFDYAAYAIRNKIGHRIYLTGNNIHILERAKEINLVEWSLIIRDRLIRILEMSGLQGEVLHLVSAVALGAREELEPETTQSFAKTGVIHVLAVSGMNVGLIYMVLHFLLKFIERKKGGIVIQTLLIIGACWGYALITGLSASVLRAATMFSFIVIGKSLSRQPNIYNTLAASAFVLLCFNPALVYDVGFQLSYAAIFSIVFFQPYLYHLYYFRFWITDYAWALITVSVAAQIGTLPILLHYFHQFPTWFLLANIMVIPLVTAILYLSFIIFAVAPVFPFLGKLITHLLDWAGQGMLLSVHFVEKLPYAVLNDLYPSDFTLFLVVVTAILFTLFIVYKKPVAFTSALISIVTLLFFIQLNSYNRLSRKEVVVFNLQGKTLIALTTGTETSWFTTEKNMPAEKFKYYTTPYEGFRRIKKGAFYSLSDTSRLNNQRVGRRGCFLNFEGMTLCVLHNQALDDIDWEHFPHTDLVILSEKTTGDLSTLNPLPAGSVIVENRNLPRRGGAAIRNMASSDRKILDTPVNGAAQIVFRTASGKGINILRSGYFNH